jgi:DNA-binding CsgD family transcriptional regulator
MRFIGLGIAAGALRMPTIASSSTTTDTTDPNPLLAALPLLATALQRLSFFCWRRKPMAAQSPALASHSVPISGRQERQRIKGSPDCRRGGGRLSPRECEVALPLSRGLSNNEIALELGISCGTVKLHVHRILVKLGAKNRHDELIRCWTGRAVCNTK